MDKDSDECLEYNNTEEIIFQNVDQLLAMETEDELTQMQYDLLTHERSAAHTLNLVASTDIDKYLSTFPVSRIIYRSSLAKCSVVWNKVSQSTVASDNAQKIANREFLVTRKTRWNSYYAAIVRITEDTISKLNELCTRIGLRTFAEREIVFLKEYCSVLKPLAKGLDILQREHYGTLLPTLETIYKENKGFSSSTISHDCWAY